MKTSILVASYGSDYWRDLGDKRALESALTQGAHEVVRVHQPDGSNASSRNTAAETATGDWLVFLDADDELDHHYLKAMAIKHGEVVMNGPSVVLTPQVSYVIRGRRRPAKFWGETDIREGNWMVIGTAVHRSAFWAAGGFVEDEPHGLEDWSIWQRVLKLGVRPVKVPDAVYVAHRSGRSKHDLLSSDRANYMAEYHKVRRRNFPELYA